MSTALQLLAAGVAQIDWRAEAKRTRGFATSLENQGHRATATVLRQWADENDALAAKLERGAP